MMENLLLLLLTVQQDETQAPQGEHRDAEAGEDIPVEWTDVGDIVEVYLYLRVVPTNHSTRLVILVRRENFQSFLLNFTWDSPRLSSP